MNPKPKIDSAVASILVMPHSRWRKWAVYFLEALDSRMQSAESCGYPHRGTGESILSDVADDLRERLKNRYW